MASHLPAPGMMRMRMAMESLIVGASLNFIVILLFMYNHNACLVSIIYKAGAQIFLFDVAMI